MLFIHLEDFFPNRYISLRCYSFEHGMIDSITLENWKTHKNSTLKFRKGTNVLVGVIGSGKSSVTDALCYGLFGTFPALQNRRISTTDLLMRKPVAADTARVEVCFRIGEKKFRVERVVKRNGTNEGRLYLNDALLIGPKPNQVTERIEDELQVTYELFSRAVYSEQNQVDYFLKLNPSERKKKFDELLDLQKYEVVRTNVNVVANQFKKNQASDQHVLEQLETAMQHMDVNTLRAKLAELDLKKRELAIQKNNLHAQQEKMVKEMKIIEERVNQFDVISKNIHALQSKREVLQNQWSFFEKQFSDLASKNISQLEMERNALISRIKEHSSKQDQRRLHELQVQKAFQRVELAEKRLQEWSHSFGGKSVNQVTTGLSDITKQLKELKQKHALCLEKVQDSLSVQRVMDAQLIELSTDEKSLAALHATCPTCKQEINPAHKGKLLNELTEKRNVLLQKKNEHVANHSKLVGERNGFELVLPPLENEEKRFMVLVSKIKDGESITSDIATAKNDLLFAQSILERFGQLSSESEVEAWRERGKKLEKAIEMIRVKEELSPLEGQLQENQRVLNTLSHVREEHHAHVAKFSSISSESDACMRELTMLSSLIADLSLRVESAEKLRVQHTQARARVERSKSVEDVLGVFSNSLVVTQQQLREGVIGAINAALQELWPSVYPYEDFLLAKVLIQDNDYVLTVKEKSGEWIAAESSLSGGERSAAALALRMAIAFVLTRQLSWIILDEPTHNLDVKSVQALSLMLKERLPNLVDQVFVITHSSEIEKAATGSLYVMQREKNEDGITIPRMITIDAGTKIV